MKHSPLIADTAGGLLHEDGSATLIHDLAALLVIQIKGHGHFGNVMHHVARGDWAAVDRALRDVLALPHGYEALSPLARNLVTMLHGTSAANLRPFRPWLLEQVERQTTGLYRRSLERRLDLLADQIRAATFVFSKSAPRILSEAR
jgi:hypothetical protein